MKKEKPALKRQTQYHSKFQIPPANPSIWYPIMVPTIAQFDQIPKEIPRTFSGNHKVTNATLVDHPKDYVAPFTISITK